MTIPYDLNRHHRRSIRLKGYDYTQPGAYFITIVTQHRECLFGEIVNGQMVLNEAGRMIQTVWDAIPEHHPGIETDAFVIMPNHIHGIVVITAANASATSASVGAGLVPAHVPAHMAGATPTGATTRVAPTGTAQTDGITTNGATPTGATTTGATTRVAPTGTAQTDGITTNGATTTGATTTGATPTGATTRVAPTGTAQTDGITTNGATTTGATTRVAPTGTAQTDGVTTIGATTTGATTRVAPTVGDVVGAFKSRTTVEYIRGVKTHGWTPFPGKLWQRNYYEHIIRDERALARIREYIATNPLRWALDRENPQRLGTDAFDLWLEQYWHSWEERPA